MAVPFDVHEYGNMHLRMKERDLIYDRGEPPAAECDFSLELQLSHDIKCSEGHPADKLILS